MATVMSNCSKNFGLYHFLERLIPLATQKALHCEPISVNGTRDNLEYGPAAGTRGGSALVVADPPRKSTPAFRRCWSRRRSPRAGDTYGALLALSNGNSGDSLLIAAANGGWDHPSLETTPEKAAPVAAEGQRPVVVVLGVHRSGTSLCSRVLRTLGVSMGDQPDVQPSNPKGHWERREIVERHDRILELLNRGY